MYGSFPELNRFQEAFHQQLLPRYRNPSPREILTIELKDSAISIMCQGNPMATFTPSSNLAIRSSELLFIYYFVYFPISWQFELDWVALKILIEKSEGETEAKLEVPKCLNLLNSILLTF